MSEMEARINEIFKSAPVMRSRDFVKNGISRAALARTLADGKLKKLVRGVYCLPDYRQSENSYLAIVASRMPEAVICLLSALRFHELTTQSPGELWIAIPNKSHPPRLGYPNLKVMRFAQSSLSFGISIHVIDGVNVRVTSVEKTIADCFKFRNKIGLDVALEALSEARSGARFDLDELWRCAKVDRVANVILPYLEATA